MKKLISIVIPAYNEEGNIPEVIKRLSALADSLVHTYNFEFLLLDNCSTDQTPQMAKKQVERDKRWKYLRYSRNFGSEASIAAGVDHCTGDAAILLFSDLQDPPEKIPEMLQVWERGVDVVYGVVRDRGDSSWLKSLGARLAYRLIYHLTDSNIPPDGTDFRLLDRKVMDALRSMREPDRYYRGLVHWVGFRQESFVYDRAPRVKGRSNANLIHCVLFAFHAIFCFSSAPMRLILIFGFSLTMLSIAMTIGYIVLFFVRPSFMHPPPPGLTTVVILALFLVGTNSLFLGLIGEYVGRIYNQGKNRPLYIIAEKANC
jgi:polyisoprenyl-phosphate glycosyltransferase